MSDKRGVGPLNIDEIVLRREGHEVVISGKDILRWHSHLDVASGISVLELSMNTVHAKVTKTDAPDK